MALFKFRIYLEKGIESKSRLGERHLKFSLEKNYRALKTGLMEPKSLKDLSPPIYVETYYKILVLLRRQEPELRNGLRVKENGFSVRRACRR